MTDWLRFLAEWIRHPAQIGAIAPTSKFVARKVIRHIPSDTKTIVEYGPGNGAVTFPVAKAFPKATLVAIERNAAFVKMLSMSQLRNLKVVEGSAQDVSNYVEKPDVILSALPFKSFPEILKHEILSNTAKNMRKDTLFIIYLQYSRVLEDYLPRYFGKIRHDYEFRNMFPTHIYICSEPK